MSQSTRQLLEVLAALSPYFLFVGALIWSELVVLVADRRADRRDKDAEPAPDRPEPSG